MALGASIRAAFLLSELRPVEPLDSKRHDASSFDSGQPTLDRWLAAFAGQSQRKDVARTFVVTDKARSVVGYYTLVAGEIEHEKASAKAKAGVSRHFPIPICLIARLAVDRTWQRKGLGTDLLRDAMRRALVASDELGLRAIAVDAIDETAAAFYVHHGFEPGTDDQLTLMIPVSGCGQLGS
jgi:GNAT superfamily N-acetyltransferase